MEVSELRKNRRDLIEYFVIFIETLEEHEGQKLGLHVSIVLYTFFEQGFEKTDALWEKQPNELIDFSDYPTIPNALVRVCVETFLSGMKLAMWGDEVFQEYLDWYKEEDFNIENWK